jgi:error-prone DNA polymerase
VPPGEASEPGSSAPATGVRMALSGVRDISDAETASIVAARRTGPFTSLEDMWRRTELSRPVLENLVHVGALDSISGGRSRRELLWRARLCEAPPARAAYGAQLSLDLDEGIAAAMPDLPGYTPVEETEAELAVAGIDFRRHLMDLYEPLAAELGCTPSTALGRTRTDTPVWVAGVKVSTQTPAIRSGQRIIFLTLDDLAGPIDVTVFERVQPRCAHTVFHSWLLLVSGVVRKRGGASLVHETDPDNVGVTVVAEEVFDLAAVAAARRGGRTLGGPPKKQPPGTAARAPVAAREGSAPPGRLWHASGGSAGR